MKRRTVSLVKSGVSQSITSRSRGTHLLISNGSLKSSMNHHNMSMIVRNQPSLLHVRKYSLRMKVSFANVQQSLIQSQKFARFLSRIKLYSPILFRCVTILTIPIAVRSHSGSSSLDFNAKTYSNYTSIDREKPVFVPSPSFWDKFKWFITRLLSALSLVTAISLSIYFYYEYTSISNAQPSTIYWGFLATIAVFFASSFIFYLTRYSYLSAGDYKKMRERALFSLKFDEIVSLHSENGEALSEAKKFLTPAELRYKFLRQGEEIGIGSVVAFAQDHGLELLHSLEMFSREELMNIAEIHNKYLALTRQYRSKKVEIEHALAKYLLDFSRARDAKIKEANASYNGSTELAFQRDIESSYSESVRKAEKKYETKVAEIESSYLKTAAAKASEKDAEESKLRSRRRKYETERNGKLAMLVPQLQRRKQQWQVEVDKAEQEFVSQRDKVALESGVDESLKKIEEEYQSGLNPLTITWKRYLLDLEKSNKTKDYIAPEPLELGNRP